MSRPRINACFAMAIRDSYEIKGRGTAYVGPCLGLPRIGAATIVFADYGKVEVEIVGVESYAIEVPRTKYRGMAGVLLRGDHQFPPGSLITAIAEDGL